MKAHLIVNPVAGTHYTDDLVGAVARYLAEHDWSVAVRRTLGPGDGITYAREAASSGIDVAIAMGGDGTLGEVASGLAHTDCTLGLIPMGTGNVWAHMVGIPTWSVRNKNAVMESARILVEGQAHRVDLGQSGDRHFMLWSGIGFDAEVIQEVERHRTLRRSVGNLADLVAAFVVGASLRGTRTTVVLDGKAMRQRLVFALVCNAQLYGRAFRVAPQARLDDGVLDVFLFKGGSMLDALRHAASVLVNLHAKDPMIEYHRARQVEIHSEHPLPLHLDGDPAGTTPVQISVAHRAISVVFPKTAPASLFEDAEQEAEESSLMHRLLARHRQEPAGDVEQT
jgi:diacylglycerol kinase (ATP)